MKIQYLNFLLSLILLFSCSEHKQKKTILKKQNISYENLEAKLFKTHEIDDIKIISIFNKKGALKNEYYLISKEKTIPDSLKNKNIIRTPVKRVICLSTTHIAFIDILNETETIKAVSGSQYIYNQKIRKGIKNKKIVDVGYENSLDFELLLSLKPDMVTVYDINGTISPTINKLKKFKIPVVQINEYIESTPLGQAEWLKFFAEFYNKQEFAKNKFINIYNSYNKLKTKTNSIKYKPSILLNMPWKGTWYIPGGKSNIAQLINDAGGNYLWKESKEKHNIPLSIEDVYLTGNKADIWLNPGQAKSIKDIIDTDIRLAKMEAVKNMNVYNRNKRLNVFGGNDYMESGTVRPDIVLKDLINILHPNILNDTTKFYYKKLKRR